MFVPWFAISFLFFLGIFLFISRLRRLILRLCQAFKDFFIFFCILIGERSSDRRNSAFQYKLYCFLTEPDLLDEAAVNEIHNCSKLHLNIDYSVQDTHKYLLQQSYVAFFRDHVTGVLRGYQVIKRVSGENCTILHFGVTVISRQYQSHGVAFTTLAYLTLKELILHPFTPVYILFRAIGFQSYVGACQICPDSTYPYYNKKTPTSLKNVVNEYMESILDESDEYNRETFVFREKSVSLKESHSAITEEDMKNPHIKFFVETNPGYLKGDLLVTCVIATWLSFLKVVKKIFGRSKKRARVPLKVATPKFGRQFSFIEKSTGMYYVPKYQTGPITEEDSDDNEDLEASPYLYKRKSVSEEEI